MKFLCFVLIAGLCLAQVEADKSCLELEEIKSSLLGKDEDHAESDIYSKLVEVTSQKCWDDDPNTMQMLNDLKRLYKVDCQDDRFVELARMKDFLAIQDYHVLLAGLKQQKMAHLEICRSKIIQQLNANRFDSFWTMKMAQTIFSIRAGQQQLKIKPAEFHAGFAKFFIDSEGTKMELIKKLPTKIFEDLEDAGKKCLRFERKLGPTYKALSLVEDGTEMALFDVPTRDWIRQTKVCQYINSYSDIDHTIIRDQLAIRAIVLKELYQLHLQALHDMVYRDSTAFEKKCHAKSKLLEDELEKLESLKDYIFIAKDLDHDYTLGVTSSDFNRGFISYFAQPKDVTKSKEELLSNELKAISDICHKVWSEMKSSREVLVQFSHRTQIENRLDYTPQVWTRKFKICEHVVMDFKWSKKVDEFVRHHYEELICKI